MIYTGLYPRLPLTSVIHLPVSMNNSIVLLKCIFDKSVFHFWLKFVCENMRILQQWGSVFPGHISSLCLIVKWNSHCKL